MPPINDWPVPAAQLPQTMDEALAMLTKSAVDAVPGVDFASITLRHPDGTLQTLAATDPAAETIDALQYRLRQGPCYEVVENNTMALANDVAHDQRWPEYGPRAASLGGACQLALELTHSDGRRAGLNLYGRRLRAFDTDAMPMAELFARHAAIVMGYARTVEQLSVAVVTRQLVGTAIGVVMQRYGLDHERAFAYLVRLSQDSNVKLRDIAHEIVDELDREHADGTNPHTEVATVDETP